MALNLGELYGKLSLDNKEFNKGLDQAEQGLQDFGSKGKMLAGAAGAAIGAALAAGIVKAVNVEAANDKVAASLGLTKKQAARAGKAAGQLYAQGLGGSMADVNSAVESVMSSVKGMRNASQKDIQAVTSRVLNMAEAFEIDTGRAAQVAGQMIQTGFADTGIEAADLLTASLQKVPKALREDLMDAVDEYGPAFQQLGIGGEKAMSMLVKGSEKGMYGIDKTGDAIKEFAIRATDMSKTTGEAYATLGLDQQKMTNALLAGGDKGAAAFQKIVGGLQDIKDPAKRSKAALALFGTPLEDLSTKDIPKFLGSLTKTGNGLGKVAGKSKDLGKTLNNNASNNIQKFTRKLQQGFVKVLGEKVIPALNTAVVWMRKNLIPAFKAVVKWVKQNQVWLGALATGVLAYIAAVKTMAAVGFVVGLIKKMAKAQWGLNAAMRANPIGLIVAAIAGLVAGFILAYNKVDWFRKAVDKAWAWIKKAINVFVQWFKTVAWPWIRNILQWLGDKIMWLWRKIVKPAFQKIGQFIGWAWKYLIKPAFKAIDWFISKVLVPVIKWLWKNIVKPAFEGIGSVIKWAWEKIIQPAFKAIWGFIKNDLIPWFQNLWEKVKPIFKKVGGFIKDTWNNVIKPVFNTLKDFIMETIPDAFDKGVKNIKKFWDGLKAIAKKPIEFMINTVYNKGIRSVFNNVMDFVGSDTRLPKLKVKGFRKGGYTGDGPKDKAAGVTHGQEYVVNAEATKQIQSKHPGLLEGMNSNGAAAVTNQISSGGGFSPIWGPFQDSIRRAGRLFVGRGARGWNIGGAASMWDKLAGLRVQGGYGSPQATTGVGPLGSILAWATGAGDITFNTQGIAPGLSSGMKTATAAHEIGHVLGLPHTGARSIMQPTIGNFMRPTAYDKRRLESLYGPGSRDPGDGGGFNPLKWVIDKVTDVLDGFIEKIPGAGGFLDIAKEIAKSVVSNIKDWALDLVSGGGTDDQGPTYSGGKRMGASVPTLMDGGGWLHDGGGTPTLVDHSRRKPDAFTPFDQWQKIVDHAGESGGLKDGDRWSMVLDDGTTLGGYMTRIADSRINRADRDAGRRRAGV